MPLARLCSGVAQDVEEAGENDPRSSVASVLRGRPQAMFDSSAEKKIGPDFFEASRTKEWKSMAALEVDGVEPTETVREAPR